MKTEDTDQSKKPFALLLGLPWMAFVGFLITTLLLANTSLGDSHSLSWITEDKIPVIFLSAIATLWIFCRLWLGYRLPWAIWSRLAGIFGLSVIEAGVAFIFLLFWAVGMIGGPINPG